MSNSKSFAFDWLMTLAFLGAIIVFLMVMPEWFWVVLPFFLTFFVKALDSM
ncbi:MAG: hypothetical protein SH848_16410 [Saprospiraceae bacterium]|nr:hypothetical protein [Saprospiraceae bacterium]MDZ4705509.1 hypothetical protein [Saprospiraceae bacterium]